METSFRPLKGRLKALQGETHERWELKKASKGGKTKAIERVAKP
jgi:hypothetical protein